jgi:GAF domain-containing protein
VAADERQYADGDGPCLQSMWQGVVVRVDDFSTEGRFGAYPEHCSAIGLRSSLSLPLVVGERSRGALNLYSGEPHAFGADDEATAGRWAAQATGALTVALLLADSEARADSLAAGLDTRTVIGTAVGLLMAQERCTSDQAFDLLKLASQRRNVKLRDVAAGIVAAHEAKVGRSASRW